MKKKILILVLCGIVIVGGIVLLILNFNTQTPQKVKTFADYNSYYHGDFKKAFKELLPLAETGDTGAQTFIANLYSAGLGVNQDYKKAYYWYSKAAAQNSPASLAGLAIMYQKGLYVKCNYKKAFELYGKAAKNSAGGKYDLAFMYLKGLGTKKDFSKAIELLEQAAEENYSAAQAKLGKIYYFGEHNISKDYPKAFNFMVKAANNGDPTAQNDLGLMFYEGKAVKQNLQEAYKWFYIAAHYNYNSSITALKSLFSSLPSSQKSKAIKDAKEWLKTHKEINFDYVNAN